MTQPRGAACRPRAGLAVARAAGGRLALTVRPYAKLEEHEFGRCDHGVSGGSAGKLRHQCKHAVGWQRR